MTATIIPSSPHSSANHKSKPDHDDCRSTIQPWLCTVQLVDEHSICSSPSSVAPSTAKENNRAAKQEKSQQQVTHSQPFPRKETRKNLPLGEEEQEHWIIVFWVLTLGCKIHLLFFRLPSSSTLTRLVVIFCLGSLLPLSRPTSPFVSWSC